MFFISSFIASKFRNSTIQLSLNSRSNLNKHVKRHELAEQKKKTECEFCELKFSSIGALNLHIKKMHYKSVPEDFQKTEIKKESGSTKTRIIMEFNKKGEFSTVVDPKKIKELNAKFDCANSMPTGNVGSGRGTGKVPPIPIANINVLEPLPKETLKEFVKDEEDPLH